MTIVLSILLTFIVAVLVYLIWTRDDGWGEI